MSIYVLAFLIGVIAGLRALTAPAVVSWAARLGWLHLEGTWLAFLGSAITPYIFSALAIGEMINDKLPKTPSRKTPVSFGARIAWAHSAERRSARERRPGLAVCGGRSGA